MAYVPPENRPTPSTRQGWLQATWSGFKNVIAATENLERVEEENARLRSQLIELIKVTTRPEERIAGVDQRLELMVKVAVQEELNCRAQRS